MSSPQLLGGLRLAPLRCAPKAKVILKPSTAKRVKQALACQPDPGQGFLSQPVLFGPPGPDSSSDQLMASLWNLCDGNSLSLFRSSDQASVPEASDLGPLLKVPQVDLGNPALDALRARGVKISKVSPAASVPVVPEEESEEQTDSTWGSAGKW